MDLITTIILGACAGIAATIIMDVTGILAQRSGLVSSAKGEWVGRWYLGIMRGQFYHHNIIDAPSQVGEKWAALAGHYLIGSILAVFYLLAADWAGISPGLLPAALGYGIATCVFPWLLVYPGLGFGVFGLKGPPGMNLFLASVVNHTFYGIGLWLAVKLFQLG